MDPFGLESSFFGFGQSNGKGRQQVSEDSVRHFSNTAAYGSSYGDSSSQFPPSYVQEAGSGKRDGGGGATTAGASSKFDGAESIVPCTVKMIKDAFLNKKLRSCEKGADSFVLHGKPVGAVVLRGWVEEVENLASRIRFKLCDGTGMIEVHYNNVSSQESDNSSNNEDSIAKDGEEDFTTSPKGNLMNSKNWRLKKLECIKKHNLLCVIGTAVSMKEELPAKQTASNTANTATSSPCITIEACHFRPLQDYSEYAYYSDIEIVYVSLEMNSSNNKKTLTFEHPCQLDYLDKTSPPLKHTYDKQQPITHDQNTQVHSDASMENNNELPESLSHITNSLQIKILQEILRQPENKAGRISTNDITKLIRKKYPNYLEEDIRIEIETLVDDGDIIYTQGDFVDIV